MRIDEMRKYEHDLKLLCFGLTPSQGGREGNLHRMRTTLSNVHFESSSQTIAHI